MKKLPRGAAVKLAVFVPLKILLLSIVIFYFIIFYNLFAGIHGLFGYANKRAFHRRYLKEHLVAELPKPQGTFVRTDGHVRGRAEIKLTEEDFYGYAQEVYDYLVSCDFQRFGTDGWVIKSMWGLSPTIAAVEAFELKDCYDRSNNSYTFVWANELEKDSEDWDAHFLEMRYYAEKSSMDFGLSYGTVSYRFVDFFDLRRLEALSVEGLPQPARDLIEDFGYKISYSMTEAEFDGYVDEVYGYIGLQEQRWNERWGVRRIAAENEAGILYRFGGYDALSDFKTDSSGKEYLFVRRGYISDESEPTADEVIPVRELFVRYDCGVAELELRYSPAYYALPVELDEAE